MAIRVSKNRVALENIPLNLSRSSTVASSTTVNLALATGNFVHVSGSAGPITSFGVVSAGSMFTLVFDATPTIAYNATSMILNTGTSNYTCAVGDRAILLSEGNGNWIVTIIKKDGTSVSSSSALVGGGATSTGTGGVVSVVASRSLASSDDGKTLTVNTTANITLTVPSGLPSGFGCAIYQASTGAVSVSGSGATVTPSTSGHTKTGGQGKIVAVIQIGTNAYSLSGGTA